MHGGNPENGKYIFLRKAIITMAKVQTIYARRPWRGLHGFTGCRYGCRCIRFSRFLNSLLTPSHPSYLQPFRLYIPRNCITPSFKLILRFHLSKKDARRKKNKKKGGKLCRMRNMFWVWDQIKFASSVRTTEKKTHRYCWLRWKLFQLAHALPFFSFNEKVIWKCI